MPNNLWGASEVALSLPERPAAYLLFVIYVALILHHLFRQRDALRRLSARNWGVVLGMSAAGLFLSQLFPIRVGAVGLHWLVPPGSAVPLTLLTALPLLLAAQLYGTAVAVPVGLLTGIGYMLGSSHDIFTPLHFSMAAALAGWLFYLPYRGRFFVTLRQPIITGMLSLLAMLPLITLTTLVSTSGPWLMSLDWSLAVSHAHLLPLLLAGVVAGAVVMLVVRNLPQTRPQLVMVSSPTERSLHLNLQAHFVAFSVGLAVVVLTAVYLLLVTLSTQLTVTQMVADADSVLAEIPEFRTRLQTLIIQDRATTQLLADDKTITAGKLSEMHRLVPEYSQLLLVDTANDSVTSTDNTAVSLTAAEETAVAAALANNVTTYAVANNPEDPYALSLITPVATTNAMPDTVLLGRIPAETMQSLVTGMQQTIGEGTGFVVDDQAIIIAHPDVERITETWPQIDLNDTRALRVESGAAGGAYLVQNTDSHTRTLVYLAKRPAESWTAVITVPYAVVLQMALKIGGPVALILLVLTMVSTISLRSLSRNITDPMQQLINAAQTVAAGGEWEPPAAYREDEIGQLNRAFDFMQRSMKQRLNELSLLLGVSHDVATNLDLNEGMPALLRGALRGTGAAGARAVVANPSGGRPLTFGVGPASERMGWLDRYIASKIRDVSELMLTTPVQIQEMLALPADRPSPVPALLAVPLFSQDRFQGVMWLGYRQTHSINLTERNLLRTLAGQATVLVENARLFASAEGGRRRLMAVLSSTADAVIVTDQTDRVLLVNPAMEKLFDIESDKVTGLPLADVIQSESLLALLQSKNLTAANPELDMGGRIYYGNASKIVANDGQVLGRVAVLHDITRYKEIDEMKSNFVADVSHDLRSPLTFMRGYATMLPMVGEMNEQQHDYLDRILGGIDQMANLVEDLLDLARIEAAVDLEMDPINTKVMLDDIAQEYWQHAHLSGNQLEVNVSDPMPDLRGDMPLIRRAITNLLTNAFKYAPNSGKIGLYAGSSNGHVIIKVHDNGPGIPEDMQPRLFEKFYRAKQRGTEKIKGTGLGLAIVKSIAERHGGWVRCDSKKGQGTTFIIALPIAPPQLNGQHSGQPNELDDVTAV